MNDYNIRRFERATRVQTFGREHAADFAAGGKAATLFGELDTLITSITGSRVGQLRGPVGKQEVIEALSEDFKDIARTARAIALDEPDFPAAAYRHPATSVETPVATHAHADALLLLLLLEDQPTETPAQKAAKTALRALFTAYELPANFVTDLRADRDRANVEFRGANAEPRYPHFSIRHSEHEPRLIRHSKFNIRHFPARRLEKRIPYRQGREKGRDTGDAHPTGTVKWAGKIFPRNTPSWVYSRVGSDTAVPQSESHPLYQGT